MSHVPTNGFASGTYDSMGHYDPFKSQQHMMNLVAKQGGGPKLTPAQQHAEELLEMVRNAENILSNWQNMTSSEFQHARKVWAEVAKPLLAVIDPPTPPTLEEALSMVQVLGGRNAVVTSECLGRAQDMLDRARRAGVKV